MGEVQLEYYSVKCAQSKGRLHISTFLIFCDRLKKLIITFSMYKAQTAFSLFRVVLCLTDERYFLF
jgi:hypothetical protein